MFWEPTCPPGLPTIFQKSIIKKCETGPSIRTDRCDLQTGYLRMGVSTSDRQTEVNRLVTMPGRFKVLEKEQQKVLATAGSLAGEHFEP